MFGGQIILLQRIPVSAHEPVFNRHRQFLPEYPGNLPGLVESPAAQAGAVQRRRNEALRQYGTFQFDAFEQRAAQRLNQVQPGLVFQFFYHPVHRIAVGATGHTAIKSRGQDKTARTHNRAGQRGPAALAGSRGMDGQIAETAATELARHGAVNRTAENTRERNQHNGFGLKQLSTCSREEG